MIYLLLAKLDVESLAMFSDVYDAINITNMSAFKSLNLVLYINGSSAA